MAGEPGAAGRPLFSRLREALFGPKQPGPEPEGTDLSWAALAGDEEGCARILESGARADEHHSQALTWSVKGRHFNIAHMLIHSGAQPNDPQCQALIQGARQGDLALCRLLVDYGARVSAVDGAAVKWAASGGHEEVLAFLVDHLSPEDTVIVTDVLAVAASKNLLSVCGALLERFELPRSALTEALYYPASFGVGAGCRLLLARGADPGALDMDTRLSLLKALRRDEVDVAVAVFPTARPADLANLALRTGNAELGDALTARTSQHVAAIRLSGRQGAGQ